MTNESEVFSRSNDEAISYHLNQFTLFCSTPGRSGKRARLVFGERNGAPRITVFTGLEAPKAIWMGFDPITFEIFLIKLEQVCKSKEQVADFIRNTEKSKTDPGKYDVRNTLHFGKDENGIVYIEIEEGNVRLMFRIDPPIWHQFYRMSDNQRMSDAEVSVVRGIAMVNTLRQVYGRWTGRLQPAYNSNTRGKAGSASGKTEPAKQNAGGYDSYIEDIGY